MNIKGKFLSFGALFVLGLAGFWGLNSCSQADFDAAIPARAELQTVKGVLTGGAFEECAYTYRAGAGSGKRCRAIAVVRIRAPDGTMMDFQTGAVREGLELSLLADTKLSGRPIEALVGRACSDIDLPCAYELVVAGDKLVSIDDAEEKLAADRRGALLLNGALFAIFLLSAVSNLFIRWQGASPPPEDATSP